MIYIFSKPKVSNWQIPVTRKNNRFSLLLNLNKFKTGGQIYCKPPDWIWWEYNLFLTVIQTKNCQRESVLCTGRNCSVPQHFRMEVALLGNKPRIYDSLPLSNRWIFSVARVLWQKRCGNIFLPNNRHPICHCVVYSSIVIDHSLAPIPKIVS